MKEFAFGLAYDTNAEDDEILPKKITQEERIGRKPADKLKDKAIIVKVSEEEKDIIEKIAKVNGFNNVSAYVRHLILYVEFNKLIK